MIRSHPDRTLSEMITYIQGLNTTSDKVELMLQAIAQWQEAEEASKKVIGARRRKGEISIDFMLDDQNMIEPPYPAGKSFTGDPPDASDGKDWGGELKWNH